MLVQSGNNRNHYQAEVNSSSSSSLQSHHGVVAPVPRSSDNLQTWTGGVVGSSVGAPTISGKNILTHLGSQSQSQGGVILTSSHSVVTSRPGIESDSVNNNNDNNRGGHLIGGGNNNRGRDSPYSSLPANTALRNAVKIPLDNDNECASVILSELDLVASVNISLLKNQQASPLGNSNHRSSNSCSSSVGVSIPPGAPSTFTTTPSTYVQGYHLPDTIPLSSELEALGGRRRGGGGGGGGGGYGSGGGGGNSDLIGGATIDAKMSDAYLSGVKPDTLKNNNNHNLRQGPMSAPNTPETMRKHQMLLRRDLPSLSHSMIVPHVSAKKDKMEFNQMMMKMSSERIDRPLSYHGRSTDSNSSPCILSTTSNGMSTPVNKRHVGGSSPAARTRKEAALFNRRSMPSPYLENRFREKFDVSALDTNLPRIDLEAIENHLRLAREEERKRRSDREEIRRRLALESEDVNEKPSGRKPSLHSRLQSSMNLQICFMNETASDSESPNSDTEAKHQQQPASLPHVKAQSGNGNDSNGGLPGGAPSEDFYARQARLQAEARQALSQAKEMARLQMTQEREQRLTSPITDMVKNSLLKVGVTLPPERRRVSRQLLTEMNVAQLQVIVNDLHTHIEVLNETLVSMLLERDDLHMEQDSMLVDIEDLTRYLAAKDNSPHQSLPLIAPSRNLLGKK